MSKRADFYVSVDIETDGPVPGLFSMLSLGCVAYNLNGTEVETFYRTLKPLPDARQDADTMEHFWKKHPEQWQEVNTNTVDPDEAMRDLRVWLRALGDEMYARPVFVAYPAGFDFTFVHWYMHRFLADDPFSFSALDLKTLAMAALGTNYHQTWKGRMPKRWFKGIDRGTAHNALDDARAQGELFWRIMSDLRANRSAAETYRARASRGFR